jgi:hypothetical protein
MIDIDYTWSTGIRVGKSITVLAKEREELLKIVSITEQLMQMHSNALTELGVKLEAPSAPVEKPKDTKTSKKVPIEHLI